MSTNALMWARSLKPSDWLTPKGIDRSRAAHILLVLCDYVNEDSRLAFPSAQTISNQTGYARNTVSKYLSYLEDKRLIKKSGSRSGIGGSNHYEIVYPKPTQDPIERTNQAPVTEEKNRTRNATQKRFRADRPWENVDMTQDEYNHMKWKESEKMRQDRSCAPLDKATSN